MTDLKSFQKFEKIKADMCIYVPTNEEIKTYSEQIVESQSSNPATLPSTSIIPACNFSTVLTSTISIGGSESIEPLTKFVINSLSHISDSHKIQLDSFGTQDGFQNLCSDTIDIIHTDCAISKPESDSCTNRNQEPLKFQVGANAFALVVSSQNSFLQQVKINELKVLFSGVGSWSDVNPAWPDEPIGNLFYHINFRIPSHIRSMVMGR